MLSAVCVCASTDSDAIKMPVNKLKLFWVAIFLVVECFGAETTTEAKEDLKEAESKDGKLEIVKQIKKVNSDGSYTIGYEADDGSFKIESRDVLGNIKGTYGFVDEDGKVKRVSYSTNSTQLMSTPEPPTVVQRIPRLNRTSTSTTRRPVYHHTTPSSASTTVIQPIPRRRTTMTATTPTTPTTERPSYSDFIKAAAEAAKTTLQEPVNIVYASPSPTTILLQSKPLLRSTAATNTQTLKSEGQILRPEVVTTTLPFIHRLSLLDGISKPVTKDQEVHGNLLRRQLAPHNKDFNVQEHIQNLRQSMGDDASHVYSASFTTGTPRPLFTTSRPRILSTTAAPTTQRVRYSVVRSDELGEKQTSSESSRDEATESTINQYSSTQPPVAAQIPASRQEPVVALRHHLQGGAVLVPISQLQGRNIQFEFVPEPTYTREVEDPRQVYVSRVPPSHLRSLPVHVDENGFVREVPRQLHRPYLAPPLPVPQPTQQELDLQNEIDQIRPPVTVRDFQKILDQLQQRQRRLEQIATITRQQPPYYPQRHIPYPTPLPYYVHRNPDHQTGPVQFIANPEQPRPYLNRPPPPPPNGYEPQQVLIRPQNAYNPAGNQAQVYAPSRRVARVLPRPGAEDEAADEDGYLPPDVREMLLLRMLQLAINPALPVEVNDVVGQETTQSTQTKKPVRNVEILGEESEVKRAKREKEGL